MRAPGREQVWPTRGPEVADVATLGPCVGPRHCTWLMHVAEEVKSRVMAVKVRNDLRRALVAATDHITGQRFNGRRDVGTQHINWPDPFQLLRHVRTTDLPLGAELWHTSTYEANLPTLDLNNVGINEPRGWRERPFKKVRTINVSVDDICLDAIDRFRSLCVLDRHQFTDLDPDFVLDASHPRTPHLGRVIVSAHRSQVGYPLNRFDPDNVGNDPFSCAVVDEVRQITKDQKRSAEMGDPLERARRMMDVGNNDHGSDCGTDVRPAFRFPLSAKNRVVGSGGWRSADSGGRFSVAPFLQTFQRPLSMADEHLVVVAGECPCQGNCVWTSCITERDECVAFQEPHLRCSSQVLLRASGHFVSETTPQGTVSQADMK